MVNEILHKRSSVAGKVPTADMLKNGELAVNYNSTDPAIYFKNTEGEMVKIIPTHELVSGETEFFDLTSDDAGKVADAAMLSKVISDNEEVIAKALGDLDSRIANKQDILVSGENIATINGNSILNGGNIYIEISPFRCTGGYSTSAKLTNGNNVATGNNCVAEGCGNTASGHYSHAEGYCNIASEETAHAEGRITSALTQDSHTEGYCNKTTNEYEHAEGSCNVSNSVSTTYGASGNTQHSVGIGTFYGGHKNAFEIMQNGDIYAYNLGDYDGTNATGTTSKTLQTVINGKQDVLVSGDNIKTINGSSILGSGNIEIQGGGAEYSAGANIDITNNTISVTGLTQYDDTAIVNRMSQLENKSNIWDAKQDPISDLESIRTGAQAGLTAVQSEAISDMATQTWVNNQGYLTEYRESDPIFTGHPAYTIKESDIAAWKQAYHMDSNGIPKTDLNSSVQASLDLADTALQADSIADCAKTTEVTSSINSAIAAETARTESTYLKSFTETDPVFMSSPAATIETSDINYWNDKYTVPSGGIPKTTLTSSVQSSLDLADTALQEHQRIKTINGISLSGEGDIIIGAGGTINIEALSGITTITQGSTVKIGLDTHITGSTTASSVSSLPVAYRAVLASISANGTLSYSALPTDGFEVHTIIHNTGSSVINVTLPSSGNYICTSEDIIYIAAGKYGEVNCLSIGGKGYVHGISSI